MPEAGGPSTQSGIKYQNTWAALYLGRLIDPKSRPASETVVSVQLEAMEAVDDIVVTYRGGEKCYIQAKENFNSNDQTWGKLWRDFQEQQDRNHQQDYRMVLAVGCNKTLSNQVKEICARAKNQASHKNWLKGLTIEHLKVIDKILAVLEGGNSQYLFNLVKKIDVEIWPLEPLEKEYAVNYMPTSNFEAQTLLAMLRDMAGGLARSRGTFNQSDLLESLSRQHSIVIQDVSEWGLDAYRRAIKSYTEQISVPGTDISGAVDELFVWLPLSKREKSNKYRDFEEEDLRWRYVEPRSNIGLRDFPRREVKRAIIDASAGFGKSVLLRAIAHKLADDAVYIPVMVPLGDFAESGSSVLEFLHNNINKQFEISIDWLRLCEGGRSVILFDGLDELSDTHRTKTTEKIAQFQSRFQNVPWLLTVRDGSVINTPLGSERLDISRLNDKAIRDLATSYSKAGSKLDVEILIQQISNNSDLARLTRIPLFLSLLLSISKTGDDLPKNRSELLERYLHLLFSPERHKPDSTQDQVIDDLRSVAEFLAFNGLEKGSIGFSEQEAISFISSSDFQGAASMYLGRLVQFGVLSRQGHKLRYTFPIIQEYLASNWIIRECPEAIEQGFRNVARRPWAQTIQFCLEKFKDSETIVDRQLQIADDAFYTALRLIARCIINGMSVSENLKQTVGNRLADAWESQSWRFADKIGHLIADGFVSPLPEKVERYLKEGRRMSCGGAEIVTAVNNPELTKETLSGFLDHDLHHQCWLHNWQDAVDDIAEDAFNLYLDRSKEARTTSDEVASISSLISKLPRDNIAASLLTHTQEDESLNIFIRLAAYPQNGEGLSRDLFDAIMPYIICEDEDKTSRWENFRAVEYFWRMEGAVNVYLDLVNTGSVKQEIIDDLTYELTIADHSKYDVAHILKEAYANFKTDREKRIGIMAAVNGDKEAFSMIVQMVPFMAQELVDILVWFSGHLDYESSIFLLEQLRLRSPVSDMPILFADYLITGISYKFELRMLLGGALDDPINHAAYGQYLNFTKELLDTEGLDYDQEAMALGMKKDLGNYSIDQSRVLELLNISFYKYTEEKNTEKNFMLEGPVRCCLELLDEQTFFKNRTIIRDIALNSEFNVNRSALECISKTGDIDDLYWMIGAYETDDSELKASVFEYLEAISVRHGKFIRQQENVLVLGE